MDTKKPVTRSLSTSLLSWVKTHDWGTLARVDTRSDGQVRIYGIVDASVNSAGEYIETNIDFPVSRLGHKLIRDWAGY